MRRYQFTVKSQLENFWHDQVYIPIRFGKQIRFRRDELIFLASLHNLTAKTLLAVSNVVLVLQCAFYWVRYKTY